MITYMFSVRDAAVEAFLPPFFARSKGEAIRSFTQAVQDEKHPFAVNRSDFTLFRIGEFDDASGLVRGPVDPERVLSALEVGGSAA